MYQPFSAVSYYYTLFLVSYTNVTSNTLSTINGPPNLTKQLSLICICLGGLGFAAHGAVVFFGARRPHCSTRYLVFLAYSAASCVNTASMVLSGAVSLTYFSLASPLGGGCGAMEPHMTGSMDKGSSIVPKIRVSRDFIDNIGSETTLTSLQPLLTNINKTTTIQVLTYIRNETSERLKRENTADMNPFTSTVTVATEAFTSRSTQPIDIDSSGNHGHPGSGQINMVIYTRGEDYVAFLRSWLPLYVLGFMLPSGLILLIAVERFYATVFPYHFSIYWSAGKKVAAITLTVAICCISILSGSADYYDDYAESAVTTSDTVDLVASNITSLNNSTEERSEKPDISPDISLNNIDDMQLSRLFTIPSAGTFAYKTDTRHTVNKNTVEQSESLRPTTLTPTTVPTSVVDKFCADPSSHFIASYTYTIYAASFVAICHLVGLGICLFGIAVGKREQARRLFYAAAGGSVSSVRFARNLSYAKLIATMIAGDVVTLGVGWLLAQPAPNVETSCSLAEEKDAGDDVPFNSLPNRRIIIATLAITLRPIWDAVVLYVGLAVCTLIFTDKGGQPFSTQLPPSRVPPSSAKYQQPRNKSFPDQGLGSGDTSNDYRGAYDDVTRRHSYDYAASPEDYYALSHAFLGTPSKGYPTTVYTDYEPSSCGYQTTTPTRAIGISMPLLGSQQQRPNFSLSSSNASSSFSKTVPKSQQQSAGRRRSSIFSRTAVLLEEHIQNSQINAEQQSDKSAESFRRSLEPLSSDLAQNGSFPVINRKQQRQLEQRRQSNGSRGGPCGDAPSLGSSTASSIGMRSARMMAIAANPMSDLQQRLDSTGVSISSRATEVSNELRLAQHHPVAAMKSLKRLADEQRSGSRNRLLASMDVEDEKEAGSRLPDKIGENNSTDVENRVFVLELSKAETGKATTAIV